MDDPITSQPPHWPLTARLYVPESWTANPQRCRGCRVPETVTFVTKPELALQLLEQAQSWYVPFKTVVADAGYGIASFLRVLDERQLPSVCAVGSDFGVRLLAEMEQASIEQTVPATRKRGQPKKPRPAPRHEVKAVTDALPKEAWQTVQWREGSQGPLSRRFVALRVHAGTGCVRHSESHGRSWTGPQIWLLAERPLIGELGDPEWFVSNMPAGTPLSRLVELAHLRLPHRAMLQGCQRRVWSGPVSRPQLAWIAPASGSGHVDLHRSCPSLFGAGDLP